MRRTTLITTALVLGATMARGETFEPAPYLAEHGVQVLTREAANELVDRDLFGNPWATVVVGNVDVYDDFPFLESRWFQIVSDPDWDRLLFGEIGQGLGAFGGEATSFGKLNQPHGLSTDGYSRVFVADTGNDRVLAFRVESEFDEMRLVPDYAIAGLSAPFDVAFSDGGTPLHPEDDRLYVANSGRNEIASWAIGTGDPQARGRVGTLGSGDGAFAGPMSLTVGRRDGMHTTDVYVSDAHNRRVVHLVDRGDALEWSRSLPHDLGLVTSLDTDHWGNVYAAAPQQGVIAKYTPEMLPIEQMTQGIDRPRSLHIPTVRMIDHRSGETRVAGQGSALIVEQWDGDSGLRLMTLGVALRDLAVVPGEGTAVEFTVSDRAHVIAEVRDETGKLVARREAGAFDAGRHVVALTADDFVEFTGGGRHQVRITASSTYDTSLVAASDIEVTMSATGQSNLPTRPMALGNVPNPFNPSTEIRFVVPAGATLEYHLAIYDTAGRRVRSLGSGAAVPGINAVLWNGQDDQGRAVGSGVYFSRLEIGNERLVSKMVLVK